MVVHVRALLEPPKSLNLLGLAGGAIRTHNVMIRVRVLLKQIKSIKSFCLAVGREVAATM